MICVQKWGRVRMSKAQFLSFLLGVQRLAKSPSDVT